MKVAKHLQMNKRFAGASAASLLEAFKMDVLPINPAVLAFRLGIDVEYTPIKMEILRKHILGSIVANDDGVKIWINFFNSPQRKRFTLAHEIGHYINHILPSSEFSAFDDTPETLHRIDKNQPDIKEREANKFAFELLIPEPMITSYISKLDKPIDDYQILQAAKTFDVSLAAMVIRLKRLRLLAGDYIFQKRA